jgi:hypothetical protein
VHADSAHPLGNAIFRSQRPRRKNTAGRAGAQSAVRIRLAVHGAAACALGCASWLNGGDYLLGHSQSLAQPLQQEHSQLQLGQSLQQSFAQHAAFSAAALLEAAGAPVRPAVMRPAPTVSPPNSFINMERSFQSNEWGTSRELGDVKTRKCFDVQSSCLAVAPHQRSHEQCRMRCGTGGGRFAR